MNDQFILIMMCPNLTSSKDFSRMSAVLFNAAKDFFFFVVLLETSQSFAKIICNAQCSERVVKNSDKYVLLENCSKI